MGAQLAARGQIRVSDAQRNLGASGICVLSQLVCREPPSPLLGNVVVVVAAEDRIMDSDG